MTQIYGCIECGMLFAGWEYCLGHIEHCRPQHYLETDKQTLQLLCQIGHPRCIVPSYQPSSMMMVEDDSSYMEEGGGEEDRERQGDDNDDDDANHDVGDCGSESFSDVSAGATTLTQDFLNPVEDDPTLQQQIQQYRETVGGVLEEDGYEAEQRDDEEERFREPLDQEYEPEPEQEPEQQQEQEEEEEAFDVQEKMIMQLFQRDFSNYTFAHHHSTSSPGSSSTHPNKTGGEDSEENNNNTQTGGR